MPIFGAAKLSNSLVLNPTTSPGTTSAGTPIVGVFQFDDSWVLDPEPGLDETIVGTNGDDEGATEAVQQGFLRYRQHEDGENGEPGNYMRIIVDPNGHQPDEDYGGMRSFTVVDLPGVITVHLHGSLDSMFIV